MWGPRARSTCSMFHFFPDLSCFSIYLSWANVECTCETRTALPHIASLKKKLSTFGYMGRLFHPNSWNLIRIRFFKTCILIKINGKFNCFICSYKVIVLTQCFLCVGSLFSHKRRVGPERQGNMGRSEMIVFPSGGSSVHWCGNLLFITWWFVSSYSSFHVICLTMDYILSQKDS